MVVNAPCDTAFDDYSKEERIMSTVLWKESAYV